MTDPFGDLEVNDNVVEIKTQAKKEKELVEDKTEVVGTLKGGGGFDAPWIVIHAASIRDLKDQISGGEADVLVEVMENLWKASNKFQSYGTVGKVLKESYPTAAAPVGATQSPDGETHHCKHGTMVYRAGIAKASGKPYRLFGCPHPVKAEQCDPIWPK